MSGTALQVAGVQRRGVRHSGYKLPVCSVAVSLIGTEAALTAFELQNGAGTRSSLFGVELSTGVVVTPVE